MKPIKLLIEATPNIEWIPPIPPSTEAFLEVESIDDHQTLLDALINTNVLKKFIFDEAIPVTEGDISSAILDQDNTNDVGSFTFKMNSTKQDKYQYFNATILANNC